MQQRQQALDQALKAQADANKALTDAEAALQKAQTAAQGTSTAVNKVRKDITDMNQSLVETSGKTQRTKEDWDKVADAVQKVNERIGVELKTAIDEPMQELSKVKQEILDLETQLSKPGTSNEDKLLIEQQIEEKKQRQLELETQIISTMASRAEAASQIAAQESNRTKDLEQEV